MLLTLRPSLHLAYANRRKVE